MVSRTRHGPTKIRLNQLCFIFSKMALGLVEEENTTSRASLVFVKHFEKATRELQGNVMEKCWMTPLDKFAG